MNLLGIETSCDETAAAIVATTGNPERPWRILSNVIASQVQIHREWGGVVPEIASRQHVRDICGVVERALEDAGCAWSDIDALAVTQGPGLVGSLLVGVSFAKAAAAALDRPVVAAHHLAGHIESIFLEHGLIPLPAAVLVVSGGHTSLYLVPEPGVYRLVGRTRDDAAGEAYDKVAKLLGLGYPGGPVIDRLSKQGNDRAVDLPTPRFTHPDRNRASVRERGGGGERGGGAPASDAVGESEGRSLSDRNRASVRERGGGGERGGGAPASDAVGESEGRSLSDRMIVEFSFSGLKTAVVRHLQQRGVAVGTGLAVPTDAGPLSPAEVADFCASFQRVVVQTLLDRTFDAARRLGARSVGIAGGVSANSRLRADALARGVREGLPVFIPALSLSTDNAAMIAAAGLRRLERGEHSDLDFNAYASIPIG